MRMAHVLGIAILAIFVLFALTPTSQAAPSADGPSIASISWILSGGGALDTSSTPLWSSLDDEDDGDGDRHHDGDHDDDGDDTDHDGDEDDDSDDDEVDDGKGGIVAVETVNWSTLKGAY